MYGPQTNKDKCFARTILLVYPLKMYDQHFFEETQCQNFNIHAARGPQIKLRLLRSELQIPDRRHRGHAWANLEQPSVILPVLRISM